MTAREDLSRLLDVPDDRLAMLDPVAEADVADLHQAVLDAMARQDDAVEQGVEKALIAVPRPLRGKARSMLFPGGGRR